MSCAAKTNNRLKPKRKPEGICKNCNGPSRIQAIYCKLCKSLGLGHRFCGEDITIDKAIDKKNGRQNAFGVIRARARKKMEAISCCQKCGYNKHIEIAHIKPISDFSLDTLVSVVNANDNLIALCPNCHWEHDNGLIKI